MKNLKYLVFLILILFPVSANANVSLNCPSSIAPGASITCRVTSSQELTGFNGNLANINQVPRTIVAQGGFTNNPTQSQNMVLTHRTGGTQVLEIRFTASNNITANQFTVSISGITTVPPSPQTTLSATVNVNRPTTTTTTTRTTTRPTTTTRTTTTAGGAGTTTTATTTTTQATTLTTTTTTQPTTERPPIPPPNPGTPNVYLRSLTIENHPIDFSRFRFEYNLRVLYEVESLNISAEAEDNAVIPVIDQEVADNLQVGENVITIFLEDEDGNETLYRLIVTRLAEGVPLASSDATIRSLTIAGHTIDFSSETLRYILEIASNINRLNFGIELNDENAEYRIEGNNDLSNGSIIRIIVTAEDGTEMTYIIEIESSSIFDTIIYYIKEYIVYIALLLFIIFALVVIMIRKSKLKKKDISTPKALGSIAGDVPAPAAVPNAAVVNAPPPAEPVETLDL